MLCRNNDKKIPDQELIFSTIEIAKEAGEAISEIYNSDFDYQFKKDLSPITTADTLSHSIITERLKTVTPEIPILSEENCNIPYNIRSQWKQYWLVDPLDGTKEFINKNGEFTVNIALIDKNTPIFGIIHIPVTNGDLKLVALFILPINMMLNRLKFQKTIKIQYLS